VQLILDEKNGNHEVWQDFNFPGILVRNKISEKEFDELIDIYLQIQAEWKALK